jgi:hypothetical protein
MKLDVPRGGRPDGVTHIGSGRSQNAMDYACDQYDDGDMINAIGSDQTCTVCGMNGHDIENCHILINMVKGLDIIKSFPDAISKTLQSHKTFVRHKPRPARGIHHIGESDPGINTVVEDDRPSLNFDEQGYI